MEDHLAGVGQVVYCQFSDMDFTSDVRAYESWDGVVIVVAKERFPPGCPPLNMELLRDSRHAEFDVAYAARRAWLDDPKNEPVPIGLPYDGENYRGLSQQAALDKLLDLRKAGYTVPDHAIEMLTAEVVAG